MNWFQQMGFIAYPLTIVAVFLVVEIVRATLSVARGGDEPASVTSARIHPVLVWGVLAAVVGVLGTVVGISVAASYLESVEQASSPLIWGGMKVALTSTIAGMLLLGISSIAWLTLQFMNGQGRVSTG